VEKEMKVVKGAEVKLGSRLHRLTLLPPIENRFSEAHSHKRRSFANYRVMSECSFEERVKCHKVI
jgi:hypothetical protein